MGTLPSRRKVLMGLGAVVARAAVAGPDPRAETPPGMVEHKGVTLAEFAALLEKSSGEKHRAGAEIAEWRLCMAALRTGWGEVSAANWREAVGLTLGVRWRREAAGGFLAEPDSAATQAYRKRQEVARRALEERLPRLVSLAEVAHRDPKLLDRQLRPGVLEDELWGVLTLRGARVLFQSIGSLKAERQGLLARGERVKLPLAEVPIEARELLERYLNDDPFQDPKRQPARTVLDLKNTEAWMVSLGRIPGTARLNELRFSLELLQQTRLATRLATSVPLPGADGTDLETYHLRQPEGAAGLQGGARPLPTMLQEKEFEGPRDRWPAHLSFGSGLAVVSDYYDGGYGSDHIRPARRRGGMPERTLDDYLDRMARGPLEVRWGYVGKVIVVQHLERALLLAGPGPLAPWLDTGK